MRQQVAKKGTETGSNSASNNGHSNQVRPWVSIVPYAYMHLHEEEDNLARDVAADPVDIHVATTSHPKTHRAESHTYTNIRSMPAGAGCLLLHKQYPLILLTSI